MQLIGQMIGHSALGQGIVIGWSDSRITASLL